MRAEADPQRSSNLNSRDVLEKLELRRLLHGDAGHEDADEDSGYLHAYPFTPKNSFVDGGFEQAYQRFVLNHVDTEAIREKLSEEKFFRGEDDN